MPTYREIIHTVSSSVNNSKRLNLYTNYYNKICNDLQLVTRQMMETYNKIYEQNKDNKLQNNSSICFSSLTNLPQYKYKNYIEENKLNITKVRSKKPFDSLIVSNILIKEYYILEKNITKYYIIPKSIMPVDKITTDNREILPDFYIIKSVLVEEIQHVDLCLYQRLIECDVVEGYLINNGWGDTKKYQGFNDFKKLIDDYNSSKYSIIFDESINNEINKGLIIDSDIFSSLLTMLSSSDTSNYTIAQEMIANCELESSKPYILFLIWRFDYLKKTHNNKNYEFCLKALLKYKNAYLKITLESFIIGILDISPEFKQTLFDCFKLYINNETGKDIIKEINVL